MHPTIHDNKIFKYQKVFISNRVVSLSDSIMDFRNGITEENRTKPIKDNHHMELAMKKLEQYSIIYEDFVSSLKNFMELAVTGNDSEVMNKVTLT